MNELPSQLELVIDGRPIDLFVGVLLGDEHFVYTDMFGRKFKLKPVTNENIKFPFIIEPIGDK